MLFARYGSAGGHPVMAKAVVRLADWQADHPFADDRDLERGVLSALRRAGIGAPAPRTLYEHEPDDDGEGEEERELEPRRRG